MFLRLLKYDILTNMRNAQSMFWVLAFPIILSTLFNIAFSGLYEGDLLFESIPAAVVYQKDNEVLRNTLKAVSSGEDALFEIKELSSEKANELLKDGKVKGIIYAGDEITLSVKSKGVEESIIKGFLDRYLVSEKIITDCIKTDPSKAQDVIDSISAEVSSINEKPMKAKNLDPYVQYFYNAIAMACLYGAFIGFSVAENNQGNISEVGARKCISPASRFVSVSASLVGSFIINSVCAVLAVIYIRYLLKINFGVPIYALIGISVLASLLGTSLGFMIGSIGKIKRQVLFSVMLAVIMLMCFLSGLMVGNMYGLVQYYAPWFNKINPAALINDSFYTINVYGVCGRLIKDLATMITESALFIVCGILLIRRRRYASL